MKISDLEKLKNEGVENLPSNERRSFLKFGLSVTGVFLGGSILSLTSARNVLGAVQVMPPPAQKFPYSPHYSMVIRQNRCIDCERCKEACAKTNHVPSYGYRTTILGMGIETSPGERKRIFWPFLGTTATGPPVCVFVRQRPHLKIRRPVLL